MINKIEEAAKIEQKACNHEGEAALKELQSLSMQDRLEVIKQLQNDAKQEGGKVYIENGQLVFDSPLAQSHKVYKN